ncbi:PREDICTED: ubiquitin carboxyl-terminal hydrolase isozyme L5-like [Amphimedon queenslandica]|uniref:Ubiquitin carboxyl-terminal hydrolase n=1 Tax=Amphimedon queenslandica TaxID=400682 RepID=A0A1X7UQW0_AMPQE|nr:PREDICTED: ubiquitin carboxyl-terminal hydrolase isozyme L5-like [Amphimedon queenslandica]|eukprot:XP_003387076.1 PREDICTED: ubiquitin carboxyl-terminal hydrolase isozyme L5-like [Amphimedon queenslandica]
MAAGEWCLIESDPGVFTELIRGFGVSGVQVEEVWSLDNDILLNLKPVHGLIFLYKWRPDDNVQGSIVEDSRIRDIFFARQEIKNACATQAVLSVLLNVTHSDVELGSVLTDFKEFAASFSPTDRGLSLTNSDQIRKVHNSFARQQMFEFDDSLSKGGEDVFHFVAFVPINGRLYELDGLKTGPIDHGATDSTDWLNTVRPILEKRMQSYSAGEIHFNLLALVSDKRAVYKKEIVKLDTRKELAAKKIQSVLSGGGESMEDNSGLPDDPEQLQVIIEEAEGEVIRLNELIRIENDKMETYRLENIRRRHNYLPLIMELLKTLAKKGRLVSLCEEAKKRKKSQTTADKAKEVK